MPSVYYGASESTNAEMALVCNMKPHEVEAVTYFLKCGSYLAVSDRMQQSKAPGSWCQTSCEQNIPQFMEKMYNHLLLIKWYQPKVLDHRANNLEPWFSSFIKGSIDTVPIFVQTTNRCFYQPKYAAPVVKFLCTTSHTGFIVQHSCAFTGATHDNQILLDSGFRSEWRPNDRFLLDGIFAATKETLVPWSGPQIWPNRLRQDQSREQYVADGWTKLRENERHAHFRARVEHEFSSAQFNRFGLFEHFNRFDTLLAHSWECAVGLLNYETKTKHGLQGRYAVPEDYTAVTRHELNSKLHAAAGMSSRYPFQEPLPWDAAVGTVRAAPVKRDRAPDAERLPAVVEAEVALSDAVTKELKDYKLESCSQWLRANGFQRIHSIVTLTKSQLPSAWVLGDKNMFMVMVKGMIKKMAAVADADKAKAVLDRMKGADRRVGGPPK